MSNPNKKSPDNLIPAYHKMITRVEEAQQSSTKRTLWQQIEAAKEKAVQLDELTREEAEHMGDYLRRDLHDAAEFIVTTERALADWIHFDLALIEDRLLSLFSMMVDQTRLELDNIAERARQATEWHSGEITSLGTLYCISCGYRLSFHQPDYIPVCPNCRATRFKRGIENEVDAE